MIYRDCNIDATDDELGKFMLDDGRTKALNEVIDWLDGRSGEWEFVIDLVFDARPEPRTIAWDREIIITHETPLLSVLCPHSEYAGDKKVEGKIDMVLTLHPLDKDKAWHVSSFLYLDDGDSVAHFNRGYDKRILYKDCWAGGYTGYRLDDFIRFGKVETSKMLHRAAYSLIC